MENLQCGRLIAASSRESADIRYGSGFDAHDEFTYVEHGGKRYAILSILELERARRQCAPGVTVLSMTEIYEKSGMMPGSCDFLIAVSKYFGVNHWLVPASFSFGHAKNLMNAGISVDVEPGEFFPERIVKTPDEIEKIAEAMRVTEEAMYMVRDFLKESSVNSSGILEWHGTVLTCDYIRGEVEAEFKRKCYTASSTIICCGSDSAMPHCIGYGPVRAGEPLVADIFPQSEKTGYWGDMTRTFVKGKALPVVQDAFRAVLAAADLAEKTVKAGVSGLMVHQLAARVMEEAGFHTRRNAAGQPCGFIHGLGHGVGLEIHENPRVSPSNPNPLPAGCVVSIEPGLYDPAWGGIRLEDLVEVTPDGCRNFCTMPKELEIP